MVERRWPSLGPTDNLSITHSIIKHRSHCHSYLLLSLLLSSITLTHSDTCCITNLITSTLTRYLAFVVRKITDSPLVPFPLAFFSVFPFLFFSVFSFFFFSLPFPFCFLLRLFYIRIDFICPSNICSSTF